MAPFQFAFQNWLAVHEGIFKDPCTACGRVLSVEGHVPPVVRAWKHDGEHDGHWEPSHPTCQ